VTWLIEPGHGDNQRLASSCPLHLHKRKIRAKPLTSAKVFLKKMLSSSSSLLKGFSGKALGGKKIFR
jgi:hypothetical protein